MTAEFWMQKHSHTTHWPILPYTFIFHPASHDQKLTLLICVNWWKMTVHLLLARLWWNQLQHVKMLFLEIYDSNRDAANMKAGASQCYCTIPSSFIQHFMIKNWYFFLLLPVSEENNLSSFTDKSLMTFSTTWKNAISGKRVQTEKLFTRRPVHHIGIFSLNFLNSHMFIHFAP